MSVNIVFGGAGGLGWGPQAVVVGNTLRRCVRGWVEYAFHSRAARTLFGAQTLSAMRQHYAPAFRAWYTFHQASALTPPVYFCNCGGISDQLWDNAS